MVRATTRLGLVLIAAGVIAAAPANAFLFSAPKQKSGPMTRDQVRIRLLDQCVLTQSGRAAGEGAGPKCNCYAAKISKALTDEEVAKYRNKLPRRLAGEADATFATCK